MLNLDLLSLPPLSIKMDSPEFPTAGGTDSNKPSPPRRELQLQGPRPTPLKIRKDSHKIKKPPIHPQNQQQQQQQQQPAPSNQFRPPVIIYTVSPKVIHTNVNDFMTLVQRLTGSSSLISSSSTSTFVDNITGGAGGGAISPAARFASIEKANSFQADKSSSSLLLLSQTSRSTTTTTHDHDGGFSSTEGLEISATVERFNNSFPGILSPVPSSLPPISPNFFSPRMMMTMDLSNNNINNSLSFLHDLSSPMFNGSFFLPSPSPAANFPSPIPPPFDLFNQFLDF